jgi:hypothetical protein
MTITFRPGRRGLLTLTAMALTVLVMTRDVRSDDAKAGSKPDPLEGAWKQIEAKNGGANEYQKLPDDVEFVIIIAGGRFVWTIVKDGKLAASAGGKYKLEDGKYSEILEFVHGAGVPESFVGSTFDFTGKVEGDKWHKVGTIQVNGQDYKIDEKHERCK